jgi:hypothetical protein
VNSSNIYCIIVNKDKPTPPVSTIYSTGPVYECVVTRDVSVRIMVKQNGGKV